MSSIIQYKILVLNKFWQPVNIIGIERAFSLLLQDHALAIYTSDRSFRMMNSSAWLELSSIEHNQANDSFVKTVHLRILVPKVLLLRKYDRLPAQEVKFTRDNLFDRDDYRCQYCGERFDSLNLNMDHVIPRDKGGKTSWENIVTSCIKCNSHKANRLPHQANMHLLRKPERPRLRPFISTLIGKNYDTDWDYFINNKKQA